MLDGQLPPRTGSPEMGDEAVAQEPRGVVESATTAGAREAIWHHVRQTEDDSARYSTWCEQAHP